LPDQRRQRRSTASRLPRAIAHLAVVCLVFFSIAIGVMSTNAGTGQSTAFRLTGVARGADQAPLDPQVVTHDLVPDPEATDALLARRSGVRVAEPTPLPTPVPPPSPPAPVKPRPVAQARPVVGNGMLIWPVKGGEITTYFSTSHQAIDIAVPAGSPVMAARAGVVTWTGWIDNGGGLQVAIDHGGGLVTRYDHLGSISVATGDTVATGDVIAKVGCTGWCTGPHVHFEVIVDGVHVNPLRYL
jgi:murein DD-endopeptidase MepM/ murein hydrolase activator NlpD